MAKNPKITYTITDEAPFLATHSLLPIIEAFTHSSGIDIETKDISLAARILSQFPNVLTDEQRTPDALAELGEMVKDPHANIIDRKSTRLNSSHVAISYAVFCLK